MGIRDFLGFGSKPRPDYLASPWSDKQLTQIVWSDVFGADFAPVDRATALSIPAMSKARDLLTSAIASLPMIAVKGVTILTDPENGAVTRVPNILETQPKWLGWTSGQLSPYLRMAWTVDDLLFYGDSLWGCLRGADHFPLEAWRIPRHLWKVGHDGHIVDDQDQRYADDSIIYIPSHVSGLLDKSGSVLRAASNIHKAVEFRTKTPIPVMEIRVEDEGITQAEKVALRDAYNKARLDANGATVVTPAGVTLVPHGDRADAGFMVEGRNSVRLDVGNITGVPAALLDGSTASASLTYSTTEGKRNEFYDYSVRPILNTIAGRLSQDDCVPYGTRVEFDRRDDLLPESPIPTTRQD